MSDIHHLAHSSLSDRLGGVTVAELGQLWDATTNQPKADHAFNEVIDFECSQGCGTQLRGSRYFAPITACDECRSKAERADKMDKAKAYWEALCPPSFRDTDKAHPDFPKSQYAATKDYLGTESLLLYGESRTGKSRLAMLLLKRALVKGNLHVGVMWPEQLKAMRKSFQPLEDVQRWGRYDLLLMDDSLITAAGDAKLTEIFKDLLDYRMRYKRHNIITSQIGSGDYKEQSNKFAEATGADKKLIEALCARVSETCKVVPFVKVEAKVDEMQEAF